MPTLLPSSARSNPAPSFTTGDGSSAPNGPGGNLSTSRGALVIPQGEADARRGDHGRARKGALQPADCDVRPNSRSCSAWYIASRLGHYDRSPDWILKQVAALIAHAGFPPPILLFDCAAPRKPKAVEGLTRASRWQLAAVDTWFDGQPSAQIPAAIAEAANDGLAGRYTHQLAARAAALAGAC